MGHGDDGGSGGLGHGVGLDSLRGVAAQGGGDDHGVLSQPVGGVVVELGGGVMIGAELLGGAGQEILAGVQLALGGAAAHEGHVFNGTGRSDFGNDVADLLHVDAIHNKFPPDMF